MTVKRRGAPSVIMLDSLAGDRNPRFLALLIDRIFWDETMARGKIAERDGESVMIGPRAVPDARTTGGAKEEVGGVATVASILPHPCVRLALDADLLGGETDLRSKGTAAPRLALAAMAHRHADRLAGAGDADFAAAAGCVAGEGGHYSNFPIQGEILWVLYDSIFSASVGKNRSGTLLLKTKL